MASTVMTHSQFNLKILGITMFVNHFFNQVDRDTANVPAVVTSIKEDTASTSLVEKLMAKIAEQDVKIKEQDTEMKYLVSARSEAVALLSRKNYSFWIHFVILSLHDFLFI